MPYDFEPKNLGDPRATRRPQEVDDPHARAYERWLDATADLVVPEIGGETSRELYELAVEAIETVGVDIDPAAANALPLAYPARTPPNVGLFLSAVYNRAEATVVSFDVELPTRPRRLGYRLPADRALLLDAPVHSTMGVESHGLIVNRTEVETYFGYSSTGTFVNCGSCLTTGFGTARAFVELGPGDGESSNPDGDRAVSVDEPDGVTGRFSGEAIPPALDAYLDELESAHRRPAGSTRPDGRDGRSYLQSLEPTPSDALVRELTSYFATNE